MTVYKTKVVVYREVEVEIFFEAPDKDAAEHMAEDMANDAELMEELSDHDVANQVWSGDVRAQVLDQPAPYKYQSVLVDESVDKWCGAWREAQ